MAEPEPMPKGRITLSKFAANLIACLVFLSLFAFLLLPANGKLMSGPGVRNVDAYQVAINGDDVEIQLT